jgi:hypothetical protein
MAALGMPDSAETYDALVAAYSERQRHYHTAEHIDHRLRELDSVPGLANDAAEVELALWFHDAVYNPYASANEERSADLACELLVETEQVAIASSVFVPTYSLRVMKGWRTSMIRSSSSTSICRSLERIATATQDSRRTFAASITGFPGRYFGASVQRSSSLLSRGRISMVRSPLVRGTS